MIFVFATCFAFFCMSTQTVFGSFESCIHGGTKYKDGEYFPPNKTFIKTDGPMQCVQCRCHHGLVVCEIENCTILNCENPIKQLGFCCLQCPDNAMKSTYEPSDLIFGQTKSDVPPENNHAADCISNGQRHKNGSVWQPIIGPFGAMACVQCQCREGNVICSRLRCNDQPCSHPKREFGECCPICPSPNTPSGRKNTMLTTCLSKSSEIFVYRTANVGNDTDEVSFAFLENAAEDNLVTLFIWNTRPQNTSDVLTIKTVTATDLMKLNLELLGSVSYKRFKKFSQRTERLRSKCYVQCLRRIRRLESSLGIVTVTSKPECDDNEIDMTGIKMA